MERERPSRSDSNGGTGVLEPKTNTIAQPHVRVDVREADQFRFSTIAASVDNMVAVALSIPDLRAARVRALKAQISARTYQVTAEQVAESLLEQMQASWKAGGHRQSFGA